MRGNDHLSADDIRELEDYFAFLRSQYGIPEGAWCSRSVLQHPPSLRPQEMPVRRTTMRPDVINRLRDIVPQRPLGYHEALRLAEEQAQLLLELTETTTRRAGADYHRLPRIEVRRMAPFPTSGASHWSKGKWRVAINATEPATRQRFSLAHEFKHIVDHRDVETDLFGLPCSGAGPDDRAHLRLLRRLPADARPGSMAALLPTGHATRWIWPRSSASVRRPWECASTRSGLPDRVPGVVLPRHGWTLRRLAGAASRTDDRLASSSENQ